MCCPKWSVCARHCYQRNISYYWKKHMKCIHIKFNIKGLNVAQLLSTEIRLLVHSGIMVQDPARLQIVSRFRTEKWGAGGGSGRLAISKNNYPCLIWYI